VWRKIRAKQNTYYTQTLAALRLECPVRRCWHFCQSRGLPRWPTK
jgi:hypothetical protein